MLCRLRVQSVERGATGTYERLPEGQSIHYNGNYLRLLRVSPRYTNNHTSDG